MSQQIAMSSALSHQSRKEGVIKKRQQEPLPQKNPTSCKKKQLAAQP